MIIFLYFLSNFKIFLFDTIPKIKKCGNYTNQKKISHRNQYTCSRDLTKVRRKIEKKGIFSIIVCQEKLCDYAIKSQKFCAEEQKEALHQRANGIYICIRGWLFNVEPIYGPDHLSIIIKKQSEKNKKS